MCMCIDVCTYQCAFVCTYLCFQCSVLFCLVYVCVCFVCCACYLVYVRSVLLSDFCSNSTNPCLQQCLRVVCIIDTRSYLLVRNCNLYWLYCVVSLSLCACVCANDVNKLLLFCRLSTSNCKHVSILIN